MTFAAAASPIPVAIGLLVALGAFLTWAALLTHPWRATPSAAPAVAQSEVDTATSSPAATPAETVTVVAVAHYRIAAPDDDAVAAAMALRVPPARPRLRLVVDTDTVVPDEVQRSA
jgi:hypothetical protein